MTDSNTIAEREYSRRVAERGDAPEFAYGEKLDKAETMFREMLKDEPLSDVLNNISKDIDDLNELEDLVKATIKRDALLMGMLIRSYLATHENEVQERLEELC